MASRPLESPECRAFECLFPRSRSSFIVRAMLAQTSRIAVYGPVRTVVWEGSAGDRRPYPDQHLINVLYGGPDMHPSGIQCIRSIIDFKIIGGSGIVEACTGRPQPHKRR